MGDPRPGPGEDPAGSEEAVTTLPSLQLRSGSSLAPCMPYSDPSEPAKVATLVIKWDMEAQRS